ncbi:phage holin family protein [Carnimonas bestiolae]|uniref:phage holin family protein n=1 Tax=Carnimonas bestiolae TaxID=3402172 RepID=UPI003EDC99DD
MAHDYIVAIALELPSLGYLVLGSYAMMLSFCIAYVRSRLGDAAPGRALLEGLLCGCLSLASFPLLQHLSLNPYLAVAIGAVVAFLGGDWLKETLAAVVGHFIDRRQR